MLNFIPLASSSKGNDYLLTNVRTPLLLEVGLRVRKLRQRLAEHFLKLTDIRAAFITHEHQDHCVGIRELMRTGRNCYMSRGTAEALNVMDMHRTQVVTPKEIYEVGDWKVKPFEAIHDAAEPLSYLLSDSEGYKFLFVTDYSYVHYQFKGLTHVAIECNYSNQILMDSVCQGQTFSEVAKRIRKNHMSLETVLEFFRATDTSKLQEVHLLHASSINSNAEAFCAAVKYHTGKPTYLAKE